MAGLPMHSFASKYVLAAEQRQTSFFTMDVDLGQLETVV